MFKVIKILIGALIIIAIFLTVWIIWDNAHFINYIENLSSKTPTLCLTDIQDLLCDETALLYKCNFSTFKLSGTIGHITYYDHSGEILAVCGTGPKAIAQNPGECRYLQKIECKNQNLCEKAIIGLEDETADWETYRQEILKFEIKYPNDWEFDDGLIDQSFLIYLGKSFSEEAQKFTCMFTITVGPIEELEYVIDSAKLHLTMDEVNEEEITLNSILATKITYSDIPIVGNYFITRTLSTKQDGQQDMGVYYFLYHGANKLDLDERGIESPGTYIYNKECTTIFNQILSTFRFLE